MLGLVEDPSLESKVNRILREQLGFTDNLTPKELHRLIDIHVPDRLPGDFRIGFNGFDWNGSAAPCSAIFKSHRWSLTAIRLKRQAPNTPPRTGNGGMSLAKEHPLDGIYFTALWKSKEMMRVCFVCNEYPRSARRDRRLDTHSGPSTRRRRA